jgi:hypothetical protein
MERPDAATKGRTSPGSPGKDPVAPGGNGDQGGIKLRILRALENDGLAMLTPVEQRQATPSGRFTELASAYIGCQPN